MKDESVTNDRRHQGLSGAAELSCTHLIVGACGGYRVGNNGCGSKECAPPVTTKEANVPLRQQSRTTPGAI